MDKGLIAKAEITINAPVSKVWPALIDPEVIKQYLFGTTVISDFKEGSPITYKGQWQDKEYEDKGIIIKIVPEKLFQSTYWSSMSGTEDKPENYATVTYELSEENGQTKLTLTQDNNKDEESKNHSEQNWQMVLGKLKELCEK